jgi:hypothetical protein
LTSGTVILSDGCFNYPNGEKREFEAFQKSIVEHDVPFWVPPARKSRPVARHGKGEIRHPI